MTTSFNMSGAQDEVVESLLTELEVGQPLEQQQMTRRGMLATAGAAFAVLAGVGSVEGGEPNGMRLASVNKQVEADIFDDEFHQKVLWSDPLFQSFLKSEYFPGQLKSKVKNKLDINEQNLPEIVIYFDNYLDILRENGVDIASNVLVRNNYITTAKSSERVNDSQFSLMGRAIRQKNGDAVVGGVYDHSGEQPELVLVKAVGRERNAENFAGVARTILYTKEFNQLWKSRDPEYKVTQVSFKGE